MHHLLADDKNKLTNLQLEFLKSLKYTATENQLEEIRSLLHFYFSRQLDFAIDNAENKEGYTAEIYEGWLRSKVDPDTKRK